MREKICPLYWAIHLFYKSAPGLESLADEDLSCKGPDCQWWCYAYASEGDTPVGGPKGDCAMVINATTDAKGRIPL